MLGHRHSRSSPASIPAACPSNITTPDGISAEAYDYLRVSTSWTLTQELDNVGASIGGGLWGFGLPAGEITANLSVDARWATYVMESDFLPTDFVNCTGLRMCLAAGTAAHRCAGCRTPMLQSMSKTTSTKARWNSTFRCSRTCRDSRTSRPTWRIAIPSIRPSMRSIPGRSDSTGRSSIRSGSAAPIRPTSARRTSTTCSSRRVSPRRSYNDRLTGGSAQGMRLASRGNPLLTPEEAKTVTVGRRADADLLPRFSMSVDFYETRLTNAITDLNYANDAVQAICLASAPAYNSPVCDLAVRPITDPSDPNYFNPAVNMPTEVRSAPVNAALQKIKGYDLQLDYSWDMAGGNFSLRHLVDLSAGQLDAHHAGFDVLYLGGAAPLDADHVPAYENSSWSVALQNRWLGSISLKSSNNDLNGQQPGGTRTTWTRVSTPTTSSTSRSPRSSRSATASWKLS